MMFKGNFFVFLVTFVLFVQFSNHSQTFQKEIKSLSKGADLILTGKVTKQQSEWTHNKSRIITKTTIQVDEYLKGNGNRNFVVVTHPGGEIDGVGELYSHMPEFKNDEEVLLFLKKEKNSPDYNVFSGEEGKISIVRNKKGEKITPSNLPLGTLKMQINRYTH